MTLVRALLVEWQGQNLIREELGERMRRELMMRNHRNEDHNMDEFWRTMRGAEKFSGIWRGHGVPFIKWVIVHRWKSSCREGEKDDTREKISNCQCKQLENFEKRRVRHK